MISLFFELRNTYIFVEKRAMDHRAKFSCCVMILTEIILTAKRIELKSIKESINIVDLVYGQFRAYYSVRP